MAKKLDNYLNVQAVEIVKAVRKIRAHADLGDKQKADAAFNKTIALVAKYYRQQMDRNGLERKIFCFSTIDLSEEGERR